MTPIARLVARWLPRALRMPALALVYALMLASILITSRYRAAQIIYVDVRGK